MKPTPTSPVDLLIFGAHPDDIEFGCGGIVAKETAAGRRAHFVICSHGEAGTNGTPEQRVRESEAAAALLGASLTFIELDGDAHLEVRAAHALKMAALIREHRPRLVLAPSLVQNQHPDHWRLGQLVRDATRLARFGGLQELIAQPVHAVSHLFFYAISAEAEPTDLKPILIDLSSPEIVSTWTAAMEVHASQMKTRNYLELQLTRAKLHGLRAGLACAQPLFPNDPLVFDSLAPLTRAGRQF